MLKKRIIPSLLIKNNKLVKGKNFKDYRNVGDPVSAIKVYSNQQADELIFIKIDDKESIRDFVNILSVASSNCFTPLTAGGGIVNLKIIETLLKSGADKVIINSYLLENKPFLKKASKVFGKSTIIAGVDIIKDNNSYQIFNNKKKKVVKNIDLFEWLKFLDNDDCGEIYINCVHADGLMNGYDIDLAKLIMKNIRTPVIFNGGAGNFNHIFELFSKTNVHAAGCSSIFHFGDNNPIRANSYIRNRGILLKKIK